MKTLYRITLGHMEFGIDQLDNGKHKSYVWNKRTEMKGDQKETIWETLGSASTWLVGEIETYQNEGVARLW